jgi:hypothetical protein
MPLGLILNLGRTIKEGDVTLFFIPGNSTRCYIVSIRELRM